MVVFRTEVFNSIHSQQQTLYSLSVACNHHFIL